MRWNGIGLKSLTFYFISGYTFLCRDNVNADYRVGCMMVYDDILEPYREIIEVRDGMGWDGIKCAGP